jgi:hypothetical protein
MSHHPDSIDLSILEPLGIDRPAHPVTMGIPFPPGALRDAAGLRLEIDTHSVPLQTRPMLTWPDSSVKWVLLDFQIDLKAGKDNGCRLLYGDGVSSPPPAVGIVTRQIESGQTASGQIIGDQATGDQATRWGASWRYAPGR